RRDLPFGEERAVLRVVTERLAAEDRGLPFHAHAVEDAHGARRARELRARRADGDRAARRLLARFEDDVLQAELLLALLLVSQRLRGAQPVEPFGGSRLDVVEAAEPDAVLDAAGLGREGRGDLVARSESPCARLLVGERDRDQERDREDPDRETKNASRGIRAPTFATTSRTVSAGRPVYESIARLA